MVSSRSPFTLGRDPAGQEGGDARRPELADVGRLGRLLVDRIVTQARIAEQPTFLRELLRRPAVIAADCDSRTEGDLRVSADDLDAALDDLMDTRNQMTRSVLGFGGTTDLSAGQPTTDGEALG